jgi:hypothetical protein
VTQTEGTEVLATKKRNRNRSRRRYSQVRAQKTVNRRVYASRTIQRLHIQKTVKTVKTKARTQQKQTRRVKTQNGIPQTHSHSFKKNPLLRRAYVCARRSIRKEVLFANNKTGSGNAKPKFTEQSKIKC